MTARTIFAMGGGGFTMEPEQPALDAYVLSLAARREPRVLFLPTAGGDPTEQIARFRTTFGEWACEPTVLSLFRLADARRPLRETVLSQDLIYVGGGSMRNMLAVWRVHGLDVLLREAWERGIVLAGLSAGAMCWFAGGITKSKGAPEPVTGLGLLPGALSVHADGEPDRRPAFLEAVGGGALPEGYLADDGVGLLFHGTSLTGAVSSRPGARAWRVTRSGGEVVQTPILPALLTDGGTGREPRPVPPDVAEFRATTRAWSRSRASGRSL